MYVLNHLACEICTPSNNQKQYAKNGQNLIGALAFESVVEWAQRCIRISNSIVNLMSKKMQRM